MASKIGFFGGSFNPLHNGHIIMLKSFIDILNLNKCILIPNHVSPFKSKNQYQLFSDEDRINILKKTFHNNDKVEIWDHEIKKGGVSYTIDTLNHAKSIFPNDELYWLIGRDHVETFHKWKDWKDILNLVKIAIVNRDNTFTNLDIEKVNNIFGEDKYRIIDAPLINISASYIRENINHKEKIKDLVPSSVLDYIN